MKEKIGSHSDLRLTARYRRLLLLVILPLFIVIMVLAANQYRDQRDQVLHGLAQHSAIYTIALEGIAKSASDHVLQMKAWSEGYLVNPPDYPSDLRKYFTPRLVNSELDGYTLDAVPEEMRPRVGQLFWLNGDPRRTEVGKGVLDHALDFFALVRLTHELTPYFKWSYFFSANRDFFNLYPWESSSDVLRHLGIPTMRAGIQTYYDYEFYLSGTPERNPQRQPYWTAPYVDAAGAGAMVTHGAPVYTGGKFHGIVATDVRLATLGQFLAGLPRAVGRLFIIDDRGVILADSTDLSSDAINKVSDVVPEVLVDRMLSKGLDEPGKLLAVNGNLLVARKTTHAPWTMLYLVNDEEVMGLLLPRLLPYAVILAVLAATVFIALYFLRREFIRPALELVHYIRDASDDSAVVAPQLPRLWQTWVGVVSRAFSENRDATRRLQESEAFKSAIVENALLSVITIDEAGAVIEFNPAAVAMFGHSREAALGRNLGDLIIPQAYRKRHSEGLSRYLRDSEARVIGKCLELSALRADGSEFPIELTISVNRIGEANYFTAFIADLTEKRAAETALRSSEEQYRSIFNSTSDALILWDAQGKMVDVNPAAWKMGGYTKDEFLGKPFDEHIHPSSFASYKEFKSDVATIKAATTETRAVRKDGAIIDLESRSIPMPYKGQPHILTITRDITEEKQVAEELARQRETLRQCEKLSAMGELLAGVAHELNNPLAILMGRATLLENKTTDPIVQTEVEKIRTAAERCGGIVRTFLAMARQKRPECKAASLNDVVTSAIDLLGYGLRTSGIELETRLAEALPEPNMDADQVGQIVINLLVNAQHVLAEQPPLRHIRVETGKSDDGVYCRVSDNGPGVPVDLRQRIFDPFFTTKGGSGGTGVGLSVSRGIAREHGGELRLENDGQGAVFVLWLPLGSACGKREPYDDLEGMNGLQAVHVLIVDDDPDVAELLSEILRSAGLETTLAHSGQEAMQWLDAHACAI